MTGPGPDAGTPPSWLRELETALLTNSQVIIYGNVRDQYLLPENGHWRVRDMRYCIWSCLRQAGFPFLLVADPVEGLRVLPPEPEAAAAVEKLIGRDAGKDQGEPLTLGTLQAALGAVVRADTPAAVAIDYASRLLVDVRHLDETEHRFFAYGEKLATTATPVYRPDGQIERYNPVIWVVGSDRDLPAWFSSGNDAVRKIAVPLPDMSDRRTAATLLAGGLVGPDAGEEERADIAGRFAEHTQGLTLRSMLEIVRLSRAGVGPTGSIEDAARCYRVGIVDNPWGKPYLRERLATAPERIGRRVRGQDQAIRRSVDIIVRSVMGLSGAQAGGSASRPRGVLFFAGPTGVGKTELAKALTELVFGDERAYIRFDMSEFSAEQSADRLVGAPPGYVGHDAGGELTNAIRQQPFSVVLFDEIEKAHPRILDKFLQVLDDGRLTDGSGSTVYFSEAVLVFTSNLGMKSTDDSGRPTDLVGPDTPRPDLERKVAGAIRHHFVDTLNRPELLNRLGDNIVIFNYIDADAAAEIFRLLLERVVVRVRKERSIELAIAAHVNDQLAELATKDLSFGGRGIGSILETTFVNPLARALFDALQEPSGEPVRLTVAGLDQVDGVWQVELAGTGPAAIEGNVA